MKIAVQKSDRISNGFLNLMARCGFRTSDIQSKLYYKFSELPIELYFIRGSDMTTLLQSNFDVAVLGKDSFLEYNLSDGFNVAKELGFAKCRMSFAGRGEVNKIADLNGKKIATAYSNILTNYAQENNLQIEIVEMNGSVESAIELGIAEVIFDIVQTGSTLLQHGLKEYFKVKDLQSVLITKDGFSSEIFDKLLFRINAVINGAACKYLMFNIEKSLLDNVLKMAPFGKSPTILQLANSNYCAVHTMCLESEIWRVAEDLQKVGAEDILVTDVDLRFL